MSSKLSAPSPKSVLSSKFVTYRRLWLDFLLGQHLNDMTGVILDLGGKRQNKRGSFCPPEKQAKAWWYLNLEINTQPDIFADVQTLPIQSESTDVVVCTEVLEHILFPAKCVAEIQRVLRPYGTALISVPFLYPIHADPYDFQRFTEDGLRNLFCAFKEVQIYPMGGYLGTLGMFLEIGLSGISGPRFVRRTLRRGLKFLAYWLYRKDLANIAKQPDSWKKFTTGYFIRAIA